MFDGDLTTKPMKNELIKEIEKLLSLDYYKFEKEQKTCLIIDFMSQIRKVALKKIKKFIGSFINYCKTESPDYVSDSYLESSLKEFERIRGRKDCELFEMSSFIMLTPLPNQIKRLWAFNKNKEVQ